MRPAGEDSVYSAFGQVIRYHYTRTHALLDKLGVYPGQPAVLFLLGKQDGLSQKEIARVLHRKAATITVMLNRMAKTRLIVRRPDPADHRVTKVHLTLRGRRVRDRVRETTRSIGAECFSGLTAGELGQLKRMLMKMRDNLAKAEGLPEK
jgi:MarR family transcriptional regulator, organic hydroperoxide resistance regulator